MSDRLGRDKIEHTPSSERVGKWTTICLGILVNEKLKKASINPYARNTAQLR